MPTPSSQPSPKFDFAEPAKRSPPVPDAFKAAPPGALAKFQPPAPTPTFPQPINPPPAPTPRFSGRTGGRIGGSFKMPPGSGVAARGAARAGGRAIPIIGGLLLAYDAYQLGCAFGLLPGSICPRPDNPSPGGATPGFSGGQCPCVLYQINTRFIFDGDTSPGDQLATGNGSTILYGPISGSRTVQLPPHPDGLPRVRIEVLCRGSSGESCQPSLVWRNAIGEIANYRSHIIQNLGPVNVNEPDNCGNPQPQPQPRGLPDIYTNIGGGNININFNVPSPAPPSPQPKPAPRIISPPSPLPDININLGDNYFGGGDDDYDFDIDFNFSPAPKGNFNDYPDIFNNFPPAPQPKTKNPDPVPKTNPPPQPAPQPKPLPEVPPPLPDKLPDDSTEQDKYIYRQNKETLDKVYKANAEILEIQTEQLKQRKILENIQSLLDFEVEGSQLIKRCDDLEVFYSYKDKVLKAISKQIQHVQAIEQTIINEVCEVEKESTVASPDWWQVRLRGDVPQIALIFRALGTKNYHKITLPHPLNINKLSAPPIPTYKKGNWQGEIVCVDNSKFLVNCESKIEAERVVNVALTLIDPVFTGLIPRLYFGERKGITVSTGNMLATSALYFSTGQQNLRPDWRVAFRYL